MQLVWDIVKNLTTDARNPLPKHVDNLLIGNEPTNEVYQYYLVDSSTGSKDAQLTLSDYSTLDWETAKSVLTSSRVSRIGIKTFPQLGAFGFYMPLYEDTGRLIIPVHSHSAKTVAPSLSISQAADSVTYTITPPEKVSYACYRIVLKYGYFAVEYITYDTVFVTAPPLPGEYEVHCVGYADEGGSCSLDSNMVRLTVAGSAPEPAVEKTIVGIAFDEAGHIVVTMSDGSTIVSSNVAPEVNQV